MNVNVCGMNVRLNSAPVDCFSYLGSQMAAVGGCPSDVIHIINEGYNSWGPLNCVLLHSNISFGINAKKCQQSR